MFFSDCNRVIPDDAVDAAAAATAAAAAAAATAAAVTALRACLCQVFTTPRWRERELLVLACKYTVEWKREGSGGGG